MGQKIHFDENIFFLSDSIRLLERNIPLLLDSEIMGEKLVSDILHISKGLTRMASLLQENTHLLNRSTHIRFLIKSTRTFLTLLSSIQGKVFPVSEALLAHIQNLPGLVSRLELMLAELEQILQTADIPEDSDQISAEEFHYLLMESPNDEDQHHHG